MRLTLRTMLAHMDGILEPEDDEDIRKKIADSEFATGLMHRIRDVMRRLRLGAPGLGDRAAGLDPNTVAEYLDNALPDDQVADFEKVCLESDMQLAEVAAAHQVLTLVLGEPVEIDPAARERMYRLPQVAVEAERAAEIRRREKPAVPEYLREPPRTRWGLRGAAVLAVAVVGIVAALAATGRLTPLLERAGFVQAEPEVAALPDPAPDADKPADPGAAVPGVRVPEDEAMPAPPPEVVPEPAAPRPSEPSAPVVEPVPAVPSREPETPDSVEPAAPPLDLVLPGVSPPGEVVEPPLFPADPHDGDMVPPVPMLEGPTEGVVQPMPVPGITLPGEPAPEPAPGLLPGEGVLVEPRAPAPVPEGPVPGVQEPVAPEGPAPPPVRSERASVGRLASDRQLLLQFSPEEGTWDRVTMQTALKPDHPLLALPTYRPVVALTAGVTVQWVGPAQGELRSGNGDGVPLLESAYGRLTMHNLGQPGTQVQLDVGTRQGTLTFTEPESGVALHVDRLAKPGDDPESDAAPLSVQLWTTRGGVVWQTAGGQPVSVGAGTRITLGSAAPEPPEPTPASPPAWVGEDQTNFLDRRASAVLEEDLLADRPAALVLREVAGAHRQREVRWLAVRCLGYLGQFDPMVAVLDSEDSKTVWFEYIDELRSAMARDPRLAAAIRESLRKHYGTDGETLYRMLWGYSADDLQGGAAAMLVDALEHERLAVRLLSFWNLREITGLGLFYRPELTAAKRQQPVQRWRERLAAGEIARKAEESPPEE